MGGRTYGVLYLRHGYSKRDERQHTVLPSEAYPADYVCLEKDRIRIVFSEEEPGPLKIGLQAQRR